MFKFLLISIHLFLLSVMGFEQGRVEKLKWRNEIPILLGETGDVTGFVSFENPNPEVPVTRIALENVGNTRVQIKAIEIRLSSGHSVGSSHLYDIGVGNRLELDVADRPTAVSSITWQMYGTSNIEVWAVSHKE